MYTSISWAVQTTCGSYYRERYPGQREDRPHSRLAGDEPPISTPCAARQYPYVRGYGMRLHLPTQYVADIGTLRAMLDRVFPKGSTPQTYAPCGCAKDLAAPGLGSVGFLDAVAAAEANAGAGVPALLGGR
jgi:hypothetical protein